MTRTLILLIFILPLCFATAAGQVQTRSEIEGKSAFINGTEAYIQQDYETALHYLQAAYQQLGDVGGVTFALAKAYQALNDATNAILFANKAVSAAPESKWYRTHLAEMYLQTGNINAALSELTTLREYHPRDSRSLYLLAHTYQKQGQFKKANKVLDEIMALTGPDITVMLLKFQNFEKLEMPDSSLSVLEQMRANNPDNLHALNLLGEYYSRSGRPDKAKEVLHSALSQNARDPQTLLTLAGVYLEEQRWDSAGNFLLKLITDPLIPADEKLNAARILYSHLQSHPKEKELIEQVAQNLDALTQTQTGAAFSLAGRFYSEIGDHEKAFANLEKAHELAPYDDISWRLHIQLLINQTRLDEAIETGLIADQYIPEDAYIRFFIGTAYLLKNDYRQARSWLQEAVRAPAHRPFKSTIYGALAEACASLGENQTATETYELALRYHPTNHNVMNSFALHLIEQSEPEKAEELILQALELAPQNAIYLGTAGYIYVKLGEFEKALQYLHDSIATGQAPPDIYEYLGHTYDKLGKPEEGAKWRQKAAQAASPAPVLHLNHD